MWVWLLYKGGNPKEMFKKVTKFFKVQYIYAETFPAWAEGYQSVSAE